MGTRNKQDKEKVGEKRGEGRDNNKHNMLLFCKIQIKYNKIQFKKIKWTGTIKK